MQIMPNCMSCEHAIELNTTGKSTCKAFPMGIPHELIHGELSHKTSYPGDHGIRFKRKPLDSV